MIGTGAALGFSPREVDDMSLWELSAAVDGWTKANNPDGAPLVPPSPEEFDALLAQYGLQ